MNLRLIIGIFFSFCIIFLSFFAFNNYFDTSKDLEDNHFFKQKFDPEIKKIILLGSSHVRQLNTTYIEDKIDKKNYVVYNLAHSGFIPQQTNRLIPNIISLQPEMVVYGVSYRDFQLKEQAISPILHSPKLVVLEQTNTGNIIFPDPKNLIKKLFDLTEFESKPINPQLTTILALKSLFENNKNDEKNKYEFFLPNTPLEPYVDKFFSRINDMENRTMEKLPLLPQDIRIDTTSRNSQIKYFHNSINELIINEINVVIFTTPQYKKWLDGIPQTEKENLYYILNETSKKYDISLYDLQEQYADLPIWTNQNHVAYNEKAIIFSDDIGKIILKEISP